MISRRLVIGPCPRGQRPSGRGSIVTRLRRSARRSFGPSTDTISRSFGIRAKDESDDVMPDRRVDAANGYASGSPCDIEGVPIRRSK